MMSTTNRTKFKKFTIRLPDSLHGQIEQAAGMDERSMNSEFVHRLVSTFRTEHELQDLRDANRVLITTMDTMREALHKAMTTVVTQPSASPNANLQHALMNLRSAHVFLNQCKKDSAGATETGAMRDAHEWCRKAGEVLAAQLMEPVQ